MNDSIWATIAGTAKGFNLPFDYVLYDLSYVNLIMYGAVLPSYDGSKKDDDLIGADEVVNCDDPAQQERILRTFSQYT